MKSELIPIIGRHPSTVVQSAKEICKQWSPWAMALAMLLGLAVVPPSAQGQTFTVLYSFQGGTDGEFPSGVVRDNAGNLYGTTLTGGAFSKGTVFKLDMTGNETVLYSFTGGADGAQPEAGVIRDAAGNLYGTTEAGGDLNLGTVFKLDKTGNETALHSFTGGADGAQPVAGVILDKAGNLYGTTPFGGTCPRFDGCGTVFRLDTTGKETVLYSFMDGADGGFPEAGLVRDAAGNLYGTASLGGTVTFTCFDGCGTVFRLDKTGKETVLYSFTGGADGDQPNGSVILDKAGDLYSTTQTGGTVITWGGTVFKLNTTGKKTVLHGFTGAPDGLNPLAGVIGDAAGNLYGTTPFGGTVSCSEGCGTGFKLDKNRRETVLHTFTGGADGQFPEAGLIRDAAGNLYGAALYGGNVSGSCSVGAGCGVVFKIAP
jgi:uncharacterized repeat protein (TIGR03803 family)